MGKILFLAFLMAGLWALPAPAAPPAAKRDPGASGRIESTPWVSHCFRPNSKVVVEVCTRWQVNWKMWVLVGEPISDYNLAWWLDSVTLASPLGERVTLVAPRVPPPLKKAVDGLALLFDAYAPVLEMNGTDTGSWVRFNTGTAVRAGKGSSFNVPGSPEWGKVFVTSFGAFIGWQREIDCRKLSPVYLESKAAKALFQRGFKLGGGMMSFCGGDGPLSGISDLESAVSALCDKTADGPREFRFCGAKPKKPEKEKAGTDGKEAKGEAAAAAQRPNALDGLPAAPGAEKGGRSDSLNAAADQLLINRRLAQERASYRPRAAAWCEEKMKQVDACYAKVACTRPPDQPTKETCAGIPGYPAQEIDVPGIVLRKQIQPGDICYVNDAECQAYTRENERAAEEERQRKAEKRAQVERERRAWKSRYGETSEQCQALPKLREAYATCTKLHAATCDPTGLETHSHCVDQRLNEAGPQEAEIRAKLQAEWAAQDRGADKERAKGNGKNSDAGTKPQRRNPLD